MNPFRIPEWGEKKEEKPRAHHPHLGLRNEIVRGDSEADTHITINVSSSAGGTAAGEYKVEYVEGSTLGRYLARLRLKRFAVYRAVYDLTNPEKGRCRMTYVPGPGAKISIGSASAGTATQYQRSSVDAQRAAAGMGGGAKVVKGRK